MIEVLEAVRAGKQDHGHAGTICFQLGRQLITANAIQIVIDDSQIKRLGGDQFARKRAVTAVCTWCPALSSTNLRAYKATSLSSTQRIMEGISTNSLLGRIAGLMRAAPLIVALQHRMRLRFCSRRAKWHMKYRQCHGDIPTVDVIAPNRWRAKNRQDTAQSVESKGWCKGRTSPSASVLRQRDRVFPATTDQVSF